MISRQALRSEPSASTPTADPVGSSGPVQIADPNQRFEWMVGVAVDHTLPANAARLCALLAFKFFDRKKMLAFPSQTKLATMLGMHVDSVQRLLAQVARAGHLRKWKGYATSNRYMLTLPIPAELPELEQPLIPAELQELRTDENEAAEASIPAIVQGQSLQDCRTISGNYSSGGAPIEHPPEIESGNIYRRARDGEDDASGALAERRADIAEDHAPEQSQCASQNPATEPIQDPAAWPPDPDDQDIADDDDSGEELTEAEEEEMRRDFLEHFNAYEDDEDRR